MRSVQSISWKRDPCSMSLQQIVPKNARSKRALEKREPHVNENPKTTLFLQGAVCSSLIQELLADLEALKRPFTIRFTKKNRVYPFEDPSSLEFFSQKNDASLLLLGSHIKKRPHSLTFIRCFGGQVLDMLELHVVQETACVLRQFKGEKCKTGVKPLLSFSGTQFESPEPNAYTLAKNIFTDFFRGGEVQELDVEGLQLLITFFAGEDGAEGEKPEISMRCWRIITKKSGQKVPRVEVDEIGPRIDFKVGRTRVADETVLKEALKKARGLEPKQKKNVETDMMGDKMGRIHLGKQDLSELQTRKMKGLKRNRDAHSDDEDQIMLDDMRDVISEDDDASEEVVETKRAKLSEV